MTARTLNRDLAIVTCSYGPDYHRCERLCRSVDRWVDSDIKHILIVPERDKPLFDKLASDRREVRTVQETVPGRYRQLPGLKKWWIDPQGWPVRGWVMQQVTKLSANYATDAEYLLFADSDIQFIRPLNLDDVLVDGKLRLHRVPGTKSTGEHLEWHKQACSLLGLEPRYSGSDYIGQLITWRNSELSAMQRYMEKVNKRPWYISVGRSFKVSEYILYGNFVDVIRQERLNGHFYTADDLCHCCWFRDEAEALRAPDTQIAKQAIAVLIQSNLGLNAAEEAELIQIAERKLEGATV